MRSLGSSILCPVYGSWAAISFFSCWCFTDFEVSSRCAFSSHGELKSFSFLTFSLSTLSLNFLYKLTLWLQNIAIDRRKPITFAFLFLPVLFVI